MHSSSISHQRLDYLDAVRAFALLLGIVFHASLSFMPVFIGWAVMDISTSSVVSTFMLLSHSFRMPLFFVIAGYFSRMNWHKDAAGHFIRSRLLRLGLPFTLGWFILRPLLVIGWMLGAISMQGEADLSVAFTMWQNSPGELPNGLFIGTHLWFLYYLALATAIVLLVRYLMSLNTALNQTIHHWADRLTDSLSKAKLAPLWLACVSAPIVWFMQNFGLDTPDKSLWPLLPVLLIYTGCFALGWLLQRQATALTDLTRLSVARWLLGLLACIATLLIADRVFQADDPNHTLIKALAVFCYALTLWSLVILTIGLFRRFLSKPNKVIRYLADASYWLYLIHLPIVVFLQVAVAELELHWLLKLSAISAITIGVSLLLYDLLVRPTLIGKILNGKRKPSALWRLLGPAQAISVSSTGRSG